MAQFLFVHGAFQGGWVWRNVALTTRRIDLLLGLTRWLAWVSLPAPLAPSNRLDPSAEFQYLLQTT